MNRWGWLRERLKELGTNPAQFAKIINWPASRVYELFSGKTKAIPQNRVVAAAKFLGISIDSLINFNSGSSEDVIFQSRLVGRFSVPADSKNVSEIDSDILALVLEQIETFMDNRKLRLGNADKARLAAIIYKHACGLPEKEQNTRIYDMINIYNDLKAEENKTKVS